MSNRFAKTKVNQAPTNAIFVVPVDVLQRSKPELVNPLLHLELAWILEGSALLQ